MLTVGNNQAVVEELLGNGLLSCPGCGGRLGGWGHASRRPVFTAGRVPVAVRPRRARCACVRGDARAASGVAAGPPVRRDGGDRGHARAGGAGAGVPGDRGGVRGAGGHGAGPAAPVPRVGGAGAGVLHPAGRGPGGRSGAAGPGGQPAGRCGGGGRRGGGRGPAAAGRGWSRCRGGSWRRCSRWGRFCPRSSVSPVSRGDVCLGVCPGLTVQREFAPARGRLLAVTVGRARDGGRERRDRA